MYIFDKIEFTIFAAIAKLESSKNWELSSIMHFIFSYCAL